MADIFYCQALFRQQIFVEFPSRRQQLVDIIKPVLLRECHKSGSVLRETIAAKTPITAVINIKVRIAYPLVGRHALAHMFIVGADFLGHSCQGVRPINLLGKINIASIFNHFRFGGGNAGLLVSSNPTGRCERSGRQKRQHQMSRIQTFFGKTDDLAIGAQHILPGRLLA